MDILSEFTRCVNKLVKRLASNLVNVNIELTERCNNNCIHCCINLPAEDQTARNSEMSTVQIKSILTEAAALGCLQVRFTGGEPLLRPDFADLYLFARKLGLKVQIFTNACLFTPSRISLLADVPPLVPLEITVYGMCRKSYEAISRVPGSFDQFREGVSNLLQKNVPFIVKAAVLPPNISELDELESWARTIPYMTDLPGHV